MKRLIAFALFLVCACACVPCLAGGAWIAAVPEAESLAKGETVNVTVRLGWWEASPGFVLVRVAFDGKLLALENAEALDGAVSSVNAEKDAVTFVYSPAVSQPGNAEADLIRLSFKAAKAGKCTVAPTITAVTDSRWVDISAESTGTVITVR